jgi:hypothetical protein
MAKSMPATVVRNSRCRMERLFQLRRDRGKGRVELRAKALHDADDRNRNTGGDQAILDGGRTGLIGQELAAFCDHGRQCRAAA